MNIFDWLQQWSQVISGIGSLVLSLSLVYLYFRQTNIQREQAEIQDEQEKWMEANHFPNLTIHDYEIENECGLDVVKIDVENVGNGSAINLRCFSKCYVPAFEYPFSIRRPVSTEEYAKRKNGSYLKSVFESNEELWGDLDKQYPFSGTVKERGLIPSGASLKPSNRLELESIVMYNFESGQENVIWSREDLIDKVADIGLNRMICYVFVRYEDMSGESHDEPICNFIINSDREHTSLVNQDHRLSIFGIADSDDEINWDVTNKKPRGIRQSVREYKYITKWYLDNLFKPYLDKYRQS
ncbi:hypothetical protein [Natronorubrum sp. FCH18a]|uniref:hypothetical protein n=1 Tax=Natronorubrum sp. FCH18a TaxID=3447018 RepID=UPI003F513D70